VTTREVIGQSSGSFVRSRHQAMVPRTSAMTEDYGGRRWSLLEATTASFEAIMGGGDAGGVQKWWSRREERGRREVTAMVCALIPCKKQKTLS